MKNENLFFKNIQRLHSKNDENILCLILFCSKIWQDSYFKENTYMIIITSTYPPERCGVGDYTYNLLQTVAAKKWQFMHIRNWSIRKFPEILRCINQTSELLINMQYPSVGYGDSIVPHLLCLYYFISKKKKFTLTIHEYSQYGWKGKIASLFLFVFAYRCIFTTSFERDAAAKIYPSILKKSRVIKIYSNIRKSSAIHNILDRKWDVGYFGYLIPRKGIEAFLNVTTHLKKNNDTLNIYIMGQIQYKNRDYAQQIIKQAAATGIECILDKDEENVANILSQTKIAYLPFPDGVSERRGSFLAVAQNECAIVTTKGKFTTQALEKACKLVDETNAAEKILQILNVNNELVKRQQQAKFYMENEIPHSWDEIASMYNTFINF
jgi:glycosyltransferase involved in cell wall biosynthesis